MSMQLATSGLAVVTPTDRPKSIRNRWLIEGFGGVFELSCYFLEYLWLKGLLTYDRVRSLPFSLIIIYLIAMCTEHSLM